MYKPTYRKGSNTVIITALTVVAVMLVGWILNIVKLLGMPGLDETAGSTGMFILRIIGIFLAPLGSILGYL